MNPGIPKKTEGQPQTDFNMCPKSLQKDLKKTLD